MAWHESEYDEFRLLIADYKTGAAALVYDKEKEEWLCGFVSDLATHTINNEEGIAFVHDVEGDYCGEFITTECSYNIAIEIYDFDRLNIVSYC